MPRLQTILRDIDELDELDELDDLPLAFTTNDERRGQTTDEMTALRRAARGGNESHDRRRSDRRKTVHRGGKR